MNFNWFANSRNRKLSCDSYEIPRLDLTVWGNGKIPEQKPEKPTEEMERPEKPTEEIEKPEKPTEVIENNPYQRWYLSNFNIAFSCRNE